MQIELPPEIVGFIRAFNIHQCINFRINNEILVPNTETSPYIPNPITYEAINEFTISCNENDYADLFKLYHEAGHIILGKICHIWYILTIPNMPNNHIDLRPRINGIINLLDLGVDDFLFIKRADVVRNSLLLVNNYFRENFDVIANNYIAQNDFLTHDSNLKTIALNVINTGKYLKDNPQTDETLRIYRNLIAAYEYRFGNRYPYRRRFTELVIILNNYRFKLFSERKIVLFLSECLNCFEIRLRIRNNQNIIELR